MSDHCEHCGPVCVCAPRNTVGTTTKYSAMPFEAWEKMRQERDEALALAAARLETIRNHASMIQEQDKFIELALEKLREK